MSEKITLSGVRVYGYHGVHEAERRDGQEFVVDVVVWADLTDSAHSDDVADTLDYGELAEVVTRVVAGPPRNLIETVAAEIAEALLAEPRPGEVEVTVHKPAAPIAAVFDDVAVTARRARSSSQFDPKLRGSPERR